MPVPDQLSFEMLCSRKMVISSLRMIKPVSAVGLALHLHSNFARKGVTMQRWDDNELGMMEAVVTKMSRIIAHMGIGEKGKHVVQQLQASHLSVLKLPPILRVS